MYLWETRSGLPTVHPFSLGDRGVLRHFPIKWSQISCPTLGLGNPPYAGSQLTKLILCSLFSSLMFIASGLLQLQASDRLFTAAAGITSSTHRPGADSFELYDTVIRLMREYYVDKIDENKLFADSAAALQFILPPECGEKAPAYGEIAGGPAKALKQLLSYASKNCGSELESLIVFSLNRILARLDPNTSILDPQTLREIKIGATGKFGGIGMVVDQKEGDYVVVGAFDGSPAQKAGIKAGDIVLQIDGHELHDLPLIDVLRKVRGSAGSIMTLKLQAPGSDQARLLKIKRRIIHVPPVRSALLDSNIGYLRLVNFQETSMKETVKALNGFWNAHGEAPAGIILDLRDNPGGLFGEAIQIANIFMNSGRITSIEGRNAKLNKEFSATGKSNFPDIPIVVLINKGSASASEILAGALQGRSNVVVAGRRSFGKASVQAVFPLKNGMAFRITTAHYYTADGRNIDKRGLEPDIELTDDYTRPELLKPNEIEHDAWVKEACEIIFTGGADKPVFDTLF